MRTNAIFIYGISFISLIAVITDLAQGKIYNWLTLPALLTGVAFSLYLMGWKGAGDSALGIGLALLVYGWMFLLGVIGGGDVKFLMALGAWGGFQYTERVSLLAIFLGGIFALLVLIFTGRIVGFARRMYYFMMTIFARELAVEAPKLDRKLNMPFGIPIAAAAVLVAWGVPLWKF